MPLLPTIAVTSTRWRTSVSRSPSENPSAVAEQQHELAARAPRDAPSA